MQTSVLLTNLRCIMSLSPLALRCCRGSWASGS